MFRFDPPAPGFVTRFAPAPTGYLHLGHVANAIAVWGVARGFGGSVLLRIEDHDRTRARAEYETAILEDLAWLGFVADSPLVRQSERETKYSEALRALESQELVYACDCSRKSLETPTVPVGAEPRYPGTCRGRLLDAGPERALRLRLERQAVTFRDRRWGDLEQVPAEQCGDVLIRDRHRSWTYQFAVVVDDLDQGVDLVIRGDDLLASTGRQIQMARLLGRETPSRFLHHPLIVRPDGQKLSKSNRDTGVRELRAAGWSAERVLGHAAAALGLTQGEPIDQAEIAARIRNTVAESACAEPSRGDEGFPRRSDR